MELKQYALRAGDGPETSYLVTWLEARRDVIVGTRLTIEGKPEVWTVESISAVSMSPGKIQHTWNNNI